MEIILLIFTTLINLKFSIQQIDTERVNDGASTSTGHHYACEYCEIQNLMLAEDIRGSNLTELVASNRTDELDIIHDEIFSNVMLAQYGSREFTDTARHRLRLDYFLAYLQETVYEIFQRACTDHYNHRRWYEYDDRRKLVLVRETISTNNNSNNCLCGNNQERTILNEPFKLPNVTFPDVAHQLNTDNDELTVFETRPYHIIPLGLIQDFLEEWLTGADDNTDNESMNYNDCANTLCGRLKRSMRKIVISRLKKTSGITNDGVWYRLGVGFQTDHNRNIFTEVFSQAFASPFDPTFYASEEHLIHYLDEDVRFVIGQDRFEELVALFYHLHNFMLSTAGLDELPPVVRLLQGFGLFVRISNAMFGGYVTPLDPQQWELRRPTEWELRLVRSVELRMELRNQRFWAITNSHVRFHNRFPRLANPSQAASIKYVWRRFFLNLMIMSMNASAKDESLVWSCNLTRLYNDYLFHETASTHTECPGCIYSFGEYAKISLSIDWQRCISNEKIPPSGWCLAWRRITKLDTGMMYDSHLNRKQHMNNNLKFAKDVEIFVDGLMARIQIKT